jgi:hypothetical protein
VISGTPTTSETADFEVTATDKLGSTESADYTITVSKGPLEIKTQTLTDAVEGERTP